MQIIMSIRMLNPRGERAATAQQLTGRTGSDSAWTCTTGAQRLQGKHAAITLQPVQYIHVHICLYPGQKYRHICALT